MHHDGVVTQAGAFILFVPANDKREHRLYRACLDCGMGVDGNVTHCPKCDSELAGQTDGSVLHVDIAHQRETIPVAMGKLQQALDEARRGHTRAIRLVVGRGLIRDEVHRHLSWLKHSGELIDYDHDNGNTGAIVVRVR